MKPNKRTLLAQLDKAKKAKDELYNEMRREERAASDRIRKRHDKRNAAAHVEIAKITKQLADCNPFKVGDLIRKRSDSDGLPVGATYQITSIIDHENVIARLVTSRGKLGASTERFNMTQKKDWKKVGAAPIGTVPTPTGVKA